MLDNYWTRINAEEREALFKVMRALVRYCWEFPKDNPTDENIADTASDALDAYDILCDEL